MNNLPLPYKRYIKIDFKSKWKYIINDRIALIIFLLIFLKNTLFFNVLSSNGAAKLSFKFDTLAVVNSYIAIAFIILFISFTFLLDKKLHLWLLILFNMAYSIILVGDLWHYRGFKSFLSLHLLSETSNLNNLSSGLISMMRPIDLIFVIDNLVIIIFALLLQRNYKNMDKSKGVFSLLFISSFVLLLFFHIIYDYTGTGYMGPRLFKTEWVPFSTMRNLSPLGYHTYDSITYINYNIPYYMSAT